MMVLLAMAPLPARSPDGLEMLALAQSWAGQGPAVDAAFWPPLWPAMVATLLPLVEAERAAWLLNLVLAGAVAWPLHLGATRLGSVWAGRAAVFFWCLAPVVREHACILDARPLGWLLTGLAVAFAIDAHRGERAWTWAFGAAALAPLARPEGLALIPLLAVSALVLRHPWRSVVPFAAGALVPTLVDGFLRSGERGTLSSLWAAWGDTWSMTDFLALVGIASAPTGYRAFVLEQVEAGVEAPPLPFVLAVPLEGALYIVEALVQCVGWAGIVAAVVGGVAVIATAKGRWQAALVLVLALSPLAALALTPMLQGQATQAANLAFVVAPLLMLACGGAVRLVQRTDRFTLLQAAPVLVAFAMLVETSTKTTAVDGLFVEDSRAADVMARHLRENPPESGRVACTLTSRGVVRRAGLEPVGVGSTWEDWSPGDGDGVLLSSVDLYLGEDGGRGLELLEDPDWHVVRVFADGQMAVWRSGGLVEDDRTFVYLARD
ncbi:MAG: hypothetical protein GY884_06415 [Proteobacteria bacterium]|nr:hypothetical protein [Pseudomonadota bacterium]